MTAAAEPAPTSAVPAIGRILALSGARRFAAVRAWRAVRHVGSVRVAVAPNPVGAIRVGFAISGVRTAVLRNQLRRRLRVAIRQPEAWQTVAGNDQAAGIDVVISAGIAATAIPYRRLAADVATALAAALDVAAARPVITS